MSDDENEKEEEDRWKVPDDFPRDRITGALPGAQPKYLVTLYEGRYYLSSCTPPEVFERWCMCEDLVAQLSVRSLESKSGKRAHMTEEAILEQYYTRLLATRWVSVDEASWIMRRVAQLIGWNVSCTNWEDEG